MSGRVRKVIRLKTAFNISSEKKTMQPIDLKGLKEVGIVGIVGIYSIANNLDCTALF